MNSEPQEAQTLRIWIPACAGMTKEKISAPLVPENKKGAVTMATAPSLILFPKTYAATRASSGRAALAWAMMTEKVSPSCIAISARTLRSSSTPASLSPCMNTP
jgi:hypothetical protein